MSTMSELDRQRQMDGVKLNSAEFRDAERVRHGMHRFSPTAVALWHSIEGKCPIETTIRRFIAEVPADVAMWWADEAYLACKIPPDGAKKQALLEAEAIYEDYLDAIDRASWEFSVSHGTCAS